LCTNYINMQNMKEYSLVASSDNLSLSVLVIQNKNTGKEPKGILQIIHGMCEYKERYIPFMEYMAQKGYVCIIHDHRGHGKKTPIGDLGYMYKGGWRAMVEDVRIVNEWIRSILPGYKCVLFGHSMGSMVARSFVKRYDDHVDELFVCGCPSYNGAAVLAQGMAKVIGMLCGGRHRSKLIDFLAFGSFNKPFRNEGYKSAWVCSDKEVLEKYHKDPLCMFTFTANGFYNLFGLMRDCYSKKGWVKKHTSIPVHFISGGEDPCRISDDKFVQAATLMRTIGYMHFSVHLFPEMRHEILNETNKLKVWNYILEHMI